MTFVRRQGLSRRIAGGKATEVLNPIFPVASALATALDPDTFTALHGTKIRRFHDRRGQERPGSDQGLQEDKGMMASLPTFVSPRRVAS